jgi:hypothetical protein
MNGLRFICRTLSLLRIIIMLFIRSALNCDFVRKNHQKRTRLKRLFKLCFLLIGSYNINIRPETINTTLTSFMIYSRLRSMMNLILRIIANIVLGLLLFLRSIQCEEAYFSKDNNPKKNGRSPRRRRNRCKNSQLAKTMKKDGTPFKGSNVQCWACGGFKHTTEKCRSPKHLVALYQKSLGKDKKAQGSESGYEAHFSILTNSKFEASCSSKDPHNPRTNEPTLTVDDNMDSDNTMVEYVLNDMVGDLL